MASEREMSNFSISQNDRRILRDLANQIAELANNPIEEAKRDIWSAHNSLERTRPLIFCDPENGWNEIITPETLECEGDYARQLEMLLRKEIFWGSRMNDDRVINSHFNIGYIHKKSGWGLHETLVGGGHGGAYTWEPPIKSYDDLDKLSFPVIEVDWEATNAQLEIVRDAIGDILTAQLSMGWWWTLGLTQTVAKLRGLETMMFDMIDQPEGLHRLMAFIRDGHLSMLDYLEENNLLHLNNSTYVGSGGFGWTKELPQSDYNDKVRPIDMWGFCESQETVSVSPGMYEEFVFPYESPILERFGLNCYGCCEPIDTRWHVVSRHPRLRRISVSPWANIASMAEKLQDKYVFSLKPNPSILASPSLDEDYIRKWLREAFEVTKGCNVEVIMKDCHTIGKDPSRPIRWTQIAREEAARIS